MLELAIEAIDHGGETAVRVAEIAARSGIAVTSIYHHFGSREGLVEAALGERVVRSYRESVEVFRRGFDRCRTLGEFRKLVRAVIRDRNSAGRAHARLARSHAVGAALGRPGLKKRVGSFLDLIDAEFSAVLAEAQRRGWMRADIDPLAMSRWLSTLTFGRVLGDLGRESWDSETWIDLTLRIVEFLLFGDRGTEEGAPVGVRTESAMPAARGSETKGESLRSASRKPAPRARRTPPAGRASSRKR